jgi:class 3 adenylate cyclase/pimeloyl-ACP methyl ester carboxylesterase
MVETPRTRYATTREGICIAYHVFGGGPFNLVFSPGWVTNIEVLWEWPAVATVFSRLAERCRVVVYDKQGTGLSDRVATLPSLEARMDDVSAVMKAAGMDTAALLGQTQGAAVNALFAATYPERVTALITYGTFARPRWAPDWTFGERDDEISDWHAHLTLEEWGTVEWAQRFCVDWGAEDLRDDPEFLTWLAKLMRFSATPTAAVSFNIAFAATDVRNVLPSIGTPTLLLHRAGQGDREEVEATAATIPLSKVIELPPSHWSPYLGEAGPMAQAIEAFLGDIHAEAARLDRVLASVLFTDIADSTRLAASLGDQAWRELVERHHTLVRALLGRFRGQEIDTAGDGFFASFDGPARAVCCAAAIIEGTARLGIAVKAGVHTGEVTSIDGKIGGLGVNIGARVGATAAPSEVLVSQTVKDLTAGSGLDLVDTGEHELKGVPGRWRLYRVASGPLSATAS